MARLETHEDAVTMWDHLTPALLLQIVPVVVFNPELLEIADQLYSPRQGQVIEIPEGKSPSSVIVYPSSYKAVAFNTFTG